MELIAPQRTDSWRGGAIAAVACLLSLTLAARLQSLTGNSGMLLALLISAAVASWYAGRWAGMLTTLIGIAAAAYFFMPPDNSFHVSDPHDTGALYSFAIGGVIISFLCGAAWQMRAGVGSVRNGEPEMMRLRSRNSHLALQSKQDGAALAASDHLLRRFAQATRVALESGSGGGELLGLARRIEQEPNESAPSLVDCSALYPGSRVPLPTVSADPAELRQLFEILAVEGERGVDCLDLSASQLPAWWLFAAVFRSPAGPLTPLQFFLCERIVIRQGGRCWANASTHGAWELRFLLPRADVPRSESKE